MPLTQADADAIVQDIKNELLQVFGDIENIDLNKAVKIRDYCEQKYKLYNSNDNPVHYAYWYTVFTEYGQAVDAARNYGIKD